MSKEFASADLTMGQMNAIVKKIGGRDAALRLLRGELVVFRTIETWKSVLIGASKSVDDLSKTLENKGFKISDWTSDLLKRTPLAKTLTEIELVLVSVADLGFTERTDLYAFYNRAKEFGLDLVPAEVGPQLRLVYSNQPMGEHLFIGMEPIADSNADLSVFLLAHLENGKLLSTRSSWNPKILLTETLWVFARRK
ncbi:MAG TPA: hypothetical protein VMT99_01435 [Candidatus Paceibacterota bacterium]|nr:hypothetical protein [Candidatus Paceibacterota bacterium]